MSNHLKGQLTRPAISGAWNNPHNAARIGREATAYIDQLEARVKVYEKRIEELEGELGARAEEADGPEPGA